MSALVTGAFLRETIAVLTVLAGVRDHAYIIPLIQSLMNVQAGVAFFGICSARAVTL